MAIIDMTQVRRHDAPVSSRQVVVMLTIFGDESHDALKQRVFAVAGVCGKEADWDALKGPWIERLGGLEFHACDCETDNGAFAGRDHQENQDLYRDLTQLLCQSGITGFGVGLDLAGFHEFFPDLIDEAPYLRPFSEVVHFFGEVTSRCNPVETAKFTFHHRLESEYSAAALYGNMVSDGVGWEARAFLDREVSFAPQSKPEIQVADLLARETMKHLDHEIGPVKRRRRSVEALLDTGRFGFRHYLRDYFESWAAQFSKLEERTGLTAAGLREWLIANRVQDTFANRLRYADEKQREG